MALLLSVWFVRPAISLSWVLAHKKVYCQHYGPILHQDQGLQQVLLLFWSHLQIFIQFLWVKKSSFLIAALRDVCQDRNSLRGPQNLNFWFWTLSTAYFFFLLSKNMAGYGTYLSLNRILIPNLDTSDPLYVVNIYQVSFYILLHKEPSVLGTYWRGQTSVPTRSAYVSLNLTILMREHFFFFFIFWTHVCGQSYIFCIRLNCGSKKEKRGTCWRFTMRL